MDISLESGGHPVHNLRSVAIAAVSCVLVAGSLSAQTGTGSMTLTGVNGANSCYSSPGTSPLECVYTSPYFAQFSGLSPAANAALLPPGGTQWDIFCVDFQHNAYIGQTTNVYLTNLSQVNLSNSNGWLGQYTRSTSLTSYLESAWLSQQIMSAGVNTDKAKDMNGAIWQIMGGTVYRNGSNTNIAAWADSAAKYVGDVTASNWVVVTPYTTNTDGSRSVASSQEFLTQVTPEPATLLLLGTGLVAMMLAAGVIRRPMA